jgi:hypothetical protein
MKANAIPERIIRIRRNLFFIERYKKDNAPEKMVEKGKYWNE